ncbi:MAG: sigma 54-interacting transcriptional regulator [Candidatus Nealsonbacteria bacterium]|nr:sigma 54-interacting transcriptional regulator [Candidatus Nealsonbacteria bacterium]
MSLVSQLAYLVIREGVKWSDVFRLVPGQSITVGRAPTNQIVLQDERCSRTHIEVFLSGGRWTLRDLDSRNGTLVGEDIIHGDRVLRAGDVIRIGRSQLVFVYRLAEAFSDSGTAVRPSGQGFPDLAETDADDDSSILAAYQPTTITHRRGQTRYLEPGEDDESSVSKRGQAAGKLCRLAFELAKAPDLSTVAELALSGLSSATATDATALLMLPRGFQGTPTGDDLEVVASQSTTEKRYHRVANSLASTVLREGEAVLARNVMGDSSLGSRDSKGEIYTTSVICAPVRRGRRVFGLIHLYSTDAEQVPDPEDLEFTLAVADTLAVALINLNRRQELAERVTQVSTENVQLRERLGVEKEIVGESPVMREVAEEIRRAAASNATVLIRGESGVGKELAARSVHYSSPRREQVFVCLNCAALAEDLLASELFGHERGAFTGATDRKIGKFEAAHRGTLMLDEIGEMSPGIQAKFLRVLEGHPFERVGGNKPVNVDVRVIAATNRDLEKDVGEERFRRDLFFRLRVLEIVVPSLRKRGDDIVLLGDFFLKKFNAETGRKILRFTPGALDKLRNYLWPGNVRELKNVIERAVVLCRSREIDEDDLLLTNLATAGDSEEREVAEGQFAPTSLADIERVHILATLHHTGWNKSRAAGILGIERSTLDRKIRRYELGEEAPRRQ